MKFGWDVIVLNGFLSEIGECLVGNDLAPGKKKLSCGWRRRRVSKRVVFKYSKTELIFSGGRDYI